MKWYVLHCQTRKEEILHNHISSMGYISYYPWIRVHPMNPRARKIHPYFPGYIFVRVNLAEIGDSVFNRMPMAIGLVSFGGEPASLSDAVVESIMHFLEKANRSRHEQMVNLRPGDRIKIQGGIFAGYDVVFDLQVPGSQRVRVLLKMLEQERVVPVELSSELIQPDKNDLTK